MLSKRTIIGLAIGSIIIGLAGYSLLDKLGPTISVNEDFIIEPGDSVTFRIPGPNHSVQYMEIYGEAFDLKLRSPGAGLQIPSSNSENTIESFKDKIVEPLTLDWVHLEDGVTEINIQNTGNSQLDIVSATEQTPNPFGFTIDLMVLTTGVIIIGFSMGFTLRKPKGF